MIASTPKRFGNSEHLADSSTFSENSKNDSPSRSLLNSGSQRPAWRIAQTGGRSTASPRAARIRRGRGAKGLFAPSLMALPQVPSSLDADVQRGDTERERVPADVAQAVAAQPL